MSDHTLLWTPHAKERARTVIQNGRHVTYTPKATKEAEENLARQWVGPPSAGDIAVQLVLSDQRVVVTVIDVPQPQSPKLRRGDIDNYSKLILDGLNGVAWKDDRQIAQLHVIKW